jgi:hypothetical protein
MNRKKLIEELVNLGIAVSAVSFDGPGGGECYAIEAEGSGWVTYYSERGSRSAVKFFDSEAAASQDLLDRLRRAFGK